MSWAGWSLSQLAVLFGVGGGAITLLYLLRMRRRKVVVPFAALWERVTRDSESRKIWRRLRRLLSWLVQLLLLGLVVAAIGDPRTNAWVRDPMTVAIVVDASASMAGPSEASTDDAPLRRIDAARERAAAQVRGLGPSDRAVVIVAAEEVSVASPLSGDISALLAGIETIEPTHGEADLSRAITLAGHAVRDNPGAQILLLTDGALDVAGASALQACVGGPTPCQIDVHTGPADNVAITAFAARRYPEARDKLEVLAEVQNLGEQPATVTLDVTADGVSVGRRALTLAPGETRREVLSDLDAARSRFEARLSADDPAALGPRFDDVAFAVVPPLSPLRVALISDGTNLFLDAALLNLGDHVRLDAATGTDDDLAEYDLVVFDLGNNPLPAQLPDTHIAVFDPWRFEDSPFPIEKARDVGRPFLTEQARKHPLLHYVVLKDINIGRGTTFALQPGDEALVRSLGDPIVVLREDEHITLGVGFDPRQSDFPMRIAFPLFIDNLVRYVEQRTPGFVASAPLGLSQALGLADLGLSPEGIGRVEVTGPDGVPQTRPVERGRFRMRALVPGIYTIAALDGPAAGAQVEVAVNQANPDASDLHSVLAAMELPEETSAGPAPEPAPLTEGPLWTALMLVAAGLIALEWATYHRRVTV
ncbi:MAG: vWA domain-containing protein [Nannocystaceae bacterium]|nr:VWA domain-containing protein [bacterium]